MRPVWRLDLPLDKSGRVHVVGPGPLLHPEAQTVDEMLEGWRDQQMCRNLGHDTISGRIRLVERLVEHAGEFPIDTFSFDLTQPTACPSSADNR